MSQEVAYVTGGMGGIGTTMCQRLHKDGFTVIAGCGPSRDHAKWLGEQKALRLHASTPRSAMSATGTRPSPRSQKVKAEHGPIDVLVNNAGITRDGMFRKMSPSRLGRGDRDQPDQPVQRDQAGHRRHGRARLGPHHQHQLGERREGPVRPDQLLRRQGRHARLHDGAGAGGGEQGRDGQHRQPGLHRAPTWSRRSARTCSTRSSPASRSSAWARRTTSRRSCPGWPPTKSGFATGADFSVNGGLHMG